jgi:hypothetical protein
MMHGNTNVKKKECFNHIDYSYKLTCQRLNRLFYFFVNFTTERLIDLVTFIIYAVAIVTYVPISGGHVGVWAAILPLP